MWRTFEEWICCDLSASIGISISLISDVLRQLRKEPEGLYNETVSSPSKALRERLETVQFDSLFSYLFLFTRDFENCVHD